MFGSEKIVVYATRGKLTTAVVSGAKKPKVKKSFEFDWSEENVDEVSAALKEKMGKKKMRLVLADDLAYVVRAEIDGGLKKDQARAAVKKLVAEEVPEKFSEGEWDWQEVVGETKGKRAVLAFVPVKQEFVVLSRGLSKAGLVIEAIEPETASKLRNDNPILGMALKENLKGDDGKVLNIDLAKVEERQEAQPTGEKKENKKLEFSLGGQKLTKDKGTKYLSWGIFGSVVLVVGSLGPAYYLISKGGGKVEQQVEQKVVGPSPSPVEVEEVVDEEVLLSDYTYQVLNGSGVAGEAGRVVELLQDAGVEEVESANADNYDYLGIEVRFREGVEQAVFDLIAGVLENDLLIEGAGLQEDSEYDIVIVVGTKNEL